jgi:hypothetical protein
MSPEFLQYACALEIKGIAENAIRYFNIHDFDAQNTGCNDVLESYYIARRSLEVLIEKTTKVVNEYKESKK